MMGGVEEDETHLNRRRPLLTRVLVNIIHAPDCSCTSTMYWLDWVLELLKMVPCWEDQCKTKKWMTNVGSETITAAA